MICVDNRKRQRTAALQDFRRFLGVSSREPSSSAAALCRFSIFALLTVSCAQTPIKPSAASTNRGSITLSEFIYEKAPFPSCHASTIAETPEGLVAAWFGGTDEKNPDVEIWSSRNLKPQTPDSKLSESGWTEPKSVGNGIQSDGKRYPCWNPVLFQAKGGPLLLFFKVGPSPSRWWGMLTKSSDHGKTWSTAKRLPDGILGPVKDKPVLLSDGTLLCPSSTEDHGWRIHLERTKDLGETWTKTEPLNDPKDFSAIQPTILLHPHNRLQLLCRSKQGVITQCWSEDGGKTWSKMTATALPNPSSGIDAVTLRDGRHLLVYNPTTRGRTPLVVGVSRDGKSWREAAVLENTPGEYSYPAIIQTADGLAHITYTWKRQRIKHVVVDPTRILRD